MGVRVLVLLLAIAVAGSAAGQEPDWYYQHPDSTSRLPTSKLFYLEQKHGLCPSQWRQDVPESLNVRIVGKWGGGPSWAVTGRDTLVYLSRGSEVVVVSFADTAGPVILNHIQAKRLAGRPVLQDTLLYLATSGYVEVFDVSDPTNALRVGAMSVPVADIDVEDSLVYVIGADSFMVWSFADPQNPWLVGACRDSGYALDVDRGYAYLRDRWGMYILDATDPTNPHRIAAWGTDIAGAKVRGDHCYVAQGSMGSNSLHVLNVSDPSSPWQEGVLSGLTGEDIHAVDTLLFMPGFDVVSVADSSSPRVVAHEPTGGYSVWTPDPPGFGLTAGWSEGLEVLNLEDITDPVLDTAMLAAASCVDISVKGGVACVASTKDYMLVLDVSSPAHPREVGRYLVAGGEMESVLNAEPFAYVPARPHADTAFHAVDISDPTHPVMVGAVESWAAPNALALSGDYLYAAEPYRFEVFSVANPRQPEWTGSCNLQKPPSDVVVRDSLALVASLPCAVIDISSPSQPEVIGTIPGSAYSIAVYDTFAYLAVNFEGLKIWGIADPAHPYRVDSIAYPRGCEVEVAESLLFYGGLDLRVLDLATPALPAEVGSYETPYRTRKVAWDGQYVYAACFIAGVCVLEYLPTGVCEELEAPVSVAERRVAVSTVARSMVRVSGAGPGAGVRVLDVTGKLVAEQAADARGRVELDMAGHPAGVLFIQVLAHSGRESHKVVLQR